MSTAGGNKYHGPFDVQVFGYDEMSPAMMPGSGPATIRREKSLTIMLVGATGMHKLLHRASLPDSALSQKEAIGFLSD